MKAGEIIKRRRETLGLTQTELAERAGYSNRSTLSRIESSSELSPKAAKKISEVLDLDIKYLINASNYSLSDLYRDRIIDSGSMSFEEASSDLNSIVGFADLYAGFSVAKSDEKRFAENLKIIESCLLDMKSIYDTNVDIELVQAYRQADDNTRKAIDTLLKLDK